MEVAQLLREAWAAVEEASLPESVQVVAFREAIRLVSPPVAAPALPAVREQVASASAARAGSHAATKGHAASADQVTEALLYDRVVQHTGVDRGKLEQLVHLEGDTVKISLSGLRLGANNADKTRTAAQILTIVRGFGFEETDTPIDAVRAEVQRLKCYDSANFSSQLGKLTGFVITGSGAARRIRAKAAGISAFADLVDTLLGAE